MKSVSKLTLSALSSRALPFFRFRPTDLKRSWCLLLRQRQKPCNFLSKRPEVSKQHPSWRAALTRSLSTMHPSPKGQTWIQSSKPAFEILFKMFSYANAWWRWTKGVNMKILEVCSSVLRNIGLPWQTQHTAAAWCEELPWGICHTREREGWALDSELVSHDHCLQKGCTWIQVACRSLRRDLGQWCLS